MRTCEKCGKANQPTRKFCIRCGSKLVKAPKRKAAKAKLPTPEVPETGRVTTGKAVEEAKAKAAAESEYSPTTEDQWVRPSEIARDRVRSTSVSSPRETELDKARRAFSRAEEVGIKEEGAGITETRMLRASEVRELIEESGQMESEPVVAPATAPAEPVPDDIPAPTEAQPPEEEIAVAPPTTEEIEEQILGSMSAFVTPTTVVDETLPAADEPAISDDTRVRPDVAEEFTSSRYEQDDATAPTEPTATPVPATRPSDALFEEVDIPVPPVVSATTPSETLSEAVDVPTPCPECNALVTLDNFDYPSEIYSAMGQARLKQARFFVVQAKYDLALSIVRIARALFEKANDTSGLAELDRVAGAAKRT